MASSRPGPVAVKFVGHDAAGLPVKRKQVHQACLPCRKRKKRCDHHAVHSDEEGPAQGEPIVSDRDASDAAAQLLRFFHHASDTPSPSTEDGQTQQRQHVAPAPPFIGDLNPESILVEATMAPAARPATSQAGESTDGRMPGILSPASPRQSGLSHRQERGPVSSNSPQLTNEIAGPFFSVPRGDGTRVTIEVQDTAQFTGLAQTLVNRGLADKIMPSDAEWRAMRNLYLIKIHPIFPIFERSTLLSLPAETELRELIKASVCLAAATDPEVHIFLTFNRGFGQSHSAKGGISRTSVTFDEYSREMANFINRRLAELQEGQQLPLIHRIRVMALTCFYWQPTEPSTRFEPHSLFARLASLVHTHGIHLDLLVRNQADGQLDANSSGNTLFKCLYALDRLLAACAGRPVMFHNDDLIRIPRPDKQDPPSFRLFMSLILILDQVIEMYRPNTKVSCIDVPVFERLAMEAEAQGEPEGILATLEVLYHAICVLSVRMARDRFRTAPECDAVSGPHHPHLPHLPPNGMNARRSHSADRILDVIKDYKLSPMPFVPYALTLSLSVAYRKWRFSQLPMFRTRGGWDFKKVLPVLQSMGEIWNSARLNGQLGQAVVLKLDRAEIMNRKRPRRTSEGGRVAGSEHGQAGVPLEHPRELPTEVLRTGTEDRNQPVKGKQEGAFTPPDAPSTPRTQVKPTQHNEPQPAENNPSLGGASSGLHGSASSPTTSSLTERPQSLPLTWTTPWTSGPQGASNNMAPSSLAWALHHKEPLPDNESGSTPRADHQTERPYMASPPDGYGVSTDAIPLPGDSGHPSSGFHSTPPVEGLDTFLDDDDALFRSWDPGFAQSVDFSFSSILDPGNPFAWPEYCNYTS